MNVGGGLEDTVCSCAFFMARSIQDCSAHGFLVVNRFVVRTTEEIALDRSQPRRSSPTKRADSGFVTHNVALSPNDDRQQLRCRRPSCWLQISAPNGKNSRVASLVHRSLRSRSVSFIWTPMTCLPPYRPLGRTPLKPVVVRARGIITNRRMRTRLSGGVGGED